MGAKKSKPVHLTTSLTRPPTVPPKATPQSLSFWRTKAATKPTTTAPVLDTKAPEKLTASDIDFNTLAYVILVLIGLIAFSMLLKNHGGGPAIDFDVEKRMKSMKRNRSSSFSMTSDQHSKKAKK